MAAAPDADEACVWCGSTEWQPEDLRACEMMFGTAEEFRLRPCNGCGSLALQDPPDDLSAAYPDDYYSLQSARNRSFGPAVEVVLRAGAAAALRMPAAILDPTIARAPYSAWCFRWFAGRGISRTDAILDVGSGDGFLLRVLAAYGFERLLGVDPHLAEEESGGSITLRRAELAEVEGTFDVIMFHHVLEHLEDPAGALEMARERVRPGGTVIVRVPLADSFARLYYGGHWAQLDAPRHRTVPTAAGVERAASQAGLAVDRAFRDSTAFQFWGSEGYTRGIPLHGPGSWLDDRENSAFTAAQVKEWETDARRLNLSGEGDQGCFVLSAERTGEGREK